MEIVLNNVHKRYALGKTEVQALRGVSLRVQAQDFLTLAGPSGSGKTSILNMLGCLDTPQEGEVLFDGVNVGRLSATERAHLRNETIGYIFQSFNLMPVLNVYENVELPARIGRGRPDEKRLREWVLHLIDAVGLADRVHHRPDELSGGQRQRVAIARALTNHPQLLLADEPTANLDSETALKILELLRKVNREEKTALVFSTHDPEISEHCDHVLRMRDGQLVTQ
ncbi:MAG: ABC transporter ATP-binding protein [Betaproteobacteria bacterium]